MTLHIDHLDFPLDSQCAEYLLYISPYSHVPHQNIDDFRLYHFRLKSITIPHIIRPSIKIMPQNEWPKEQSYQHIATSHILCRRPSLDLGIR